MKPDSEDIRPEQENQTDQRGTNKVDNVDNEKEKSDILELESFFEIDPSTTVDVPTEARWTVSSILSNSSQIFSSGWSFLNQIYALLPSREALEPYIPSVSVTFPGVQLPIEPSNREDDNLQLQSQMQLPLQEINCKGLDPDFRIPYDELEIVKEINRGIQGIVYRAKWRATFVAVKQMLNSRATPELHNAFLKEIKIMARLRHPNIVQFMGVVDEPSKGFLIVMEYMPCTLSALLENKKIGINWEYRCRLSMGIARAIAFLHPKVLHRDIKSPNIFVTSDWSTKLGDFGLSVILSERKMRVDQGTGTPLWMAPELLLGKECTSESDVFSVGTVYYEIASRKSPHQDVNSLFALHQKLITANKRDDIPPETPETYKNLILYCWNKVAAQRPKAEEIVSCLEKFDVEIQTRQKNNP